jgi:hypothetical protein
MGVARPNHKPNVAANVKSAKVDKLFIDIPKETTMRFRFAPPMDEAGLLFYRAANHFKVKSEEGKNTALACLHEHATPESGDSCYLCKLSKHLFKYGDKAQKDVAKAISQSLQWYSQVLVAEKDMNTGLWEYTGPKLLRLPMTGVQAVNEIMSNQAKNDEDFFCDPDAGHDLTIKRHGKSPWYTADRVSNHCSLDDVFPGWESKFLGDIYGELRLNIVTFKEQREAAIRMWGDTLDFNELAEFNL